MNGPDSVQRAGKVCAQCKHFYVRIDIEDEIVNEFNRSFLVRHASDVTDSNEIRLCYEVHWCNASSLVCDDDFEPLGGVEMSVPDAESMLNNFNQVYPGVREMIRKFAKPQKEIQYVYIGLLQRTSNGALIEIPAEIDGVATNYRRVEMGPLDWDLFFVDARGKHDHSEFHPNTATNNVDITFPVAQTSWNDVEYFGVYDSLAGGKLIMRDDFAEIDNMPVCRCASIDVGGLEIPLEHLTDNHEKKGGE